MKILFIDTMHPFLMQALRKDGHECIEGYEFSAEQINSILPSVNGIVIRSRFTLDRIFLEKATALRFIARGGAGMESIDVDFAQGMNISCLNSPEGNRDAVGEHATGMLLALMNNLTRADRQVRNGEWIREPNRGHELKGKNVGIIGFGNMGSAFAEKLSGFGCAISAFDKYKKGFESAAVSEVTMEEIYRETDVLSIHVPLTKETEYFVDDTFINNFSKPVYLINTARGKCVRTTDLVKNIKSGKILGACLDVIEFEDTSFEKFSLKNVEHIPEWQFLIASEKVILSPHIAGWTFESNEKIARTLFDKIKSTIR